MTERPRRRRSDGRTDTREALLRAAVAVIERDGMAGATTRRIAEEAGLPLGAVHYWFADKSDLLAGVVDALMADVRDAADTAHAATVAEGDETPPLDVAARIEAALGRFVAQPEGRQLALFEVTLHAIRTTPDRRPAREQYAAYRAIARAAIEPIAAEADRTLPGGSDAVASLLVALFDGLTLAELADPDPDRTRAVTELFGALLARSLPHSPPR